MSLKKIFFLSIVTIILSSTTSFAHFGLILPSDDIIEGQSNQKLDIIVAFCHPFEQLGMELVKPQKFGVIISGKNQDLTSSLRKTKYLGHTAWNINYPIKRPGDHIFYMIPTPYWEETEGKYIQHITKVIVNAYGLEDSWDKPQGLPAEIVPLTRPYGLWTGNLFCGRVYYSGKPASHVQVEIGYLNNAKPKVQSPKDAYITQVVLTNADGEFCYSVPRAGWWGFSALHEIEAASERNGHPVPLEIGAVMWIKARDMKGE